MREAAVAAFAKSWRREQARRRAALSPTGAVPLSCSPPLLTAAPGADVGARVYRRPDGRSVHRRTSDCHPRAHGRRRARLRSHGCGSPRRDGGCWQADDDLFRGRESNRRQGRAHFEGREGRIFRCDIGTRLWPTCRSIQPTRIAAHAAARTYSPNDAMPLVDAGRLGEYLDILKRSVGRLSEHGHAD
jgi:hypothetical protein